MAHPYQHRTENFLVPEHDYEEHTGMTNNHGPTTIVYKRGGASGPIAATETLTYDSNNKIATRSIDWNV
jgi:hypothetical protein